MPDIKQMVDEYAKWASLMDDCKVQIDKLKGEFQKLGIQEIKDKKIKQAEFWGSDNARVLVTATESLKVFSHTYLKNTLGEILNDFAKEKTTYEYSKPFERILISICQGSYIDQTLDQVILQITSDEKTGKVLRKKLKGNWEKDVATLQAIAGMEREAAEQYAYFVQESVNYERILQLMSMAGFNEKTDIFEKAIACIRNAAIVEEGIKVGIETNEAE